MREWFEGKDFTSDFVSAHMSSWEDAVARLRNHPSRVLEIGSSEGRSAVAFLNLLPNSTITCVDAWDGEIGRERQARFDKNLKEYASRVEKVVGRSAQTLPALIMAGRKFDVAYVDGDHARDTVCSDILHAWQMLDAGGVMILDDYLWGQGLPDEQRPQQAIDWFLSSHADELSLVRKTYQVTVEKRVRRARFGPRTWPFKLSRN